MLSLVSAPVLGYDLARHPQGEAVATVLLRALACGPAETPVFAAAWQRISPDRRRLAWSEVRALPGATHGAEPVGQDIGQLITQAQQLMIFDLEDLRRTLRTDVFAWCDPATTLQPDPSGPPITVYGDRRLVGHAADVFLDAVASVWSPGLDPTTRRTLASAFVHADGQTTAADPDLGPLHAEIVILLRRLETLSSSERSLLREVSHAAGGLRSRWSEAMHEASWAVFTAGRIRSAAAVQLLGVRAFAASGLTHRDAADGIWNAVSGHLQAAVVADLLPTDIFDTLTAIWRETFDARPG